MAIDTRNKRSSAINPMCPWRCRFPSPDAAISQADRQHADLMYEGILAVNPWNSEQFRVVYRRMHNVDDQAITYYRNPIEPEE